jgi:hypothetical protein
VTGRGSVTLETTPVTFYPTALVARVTGGYRVLTGEAPVKKRAEISRKYSQCTSDRGRDRERQGVVVALW